MTPKPSSKSEMTSAATAPGGGTIAQVPEPPVPVVPPAEPPVPVVPPRPVVPPALPPVPPVLPPVPPALPPVPVAVVHVPFVQVPLHGLLQPPQLVLLELVSSLPLAQSAVLSLPTPEGVDFGDGFLAYRVQGLHDTVVDARGVLGIEPAISYGESLPLVHGKPVSRTTS